MKLQYKAGSLRVSTMTCEIRFDDAYRYLDRCGNTISKIRAFDKHWTPGETNPQNAALIHTKYKLSTSVNTHRMIVSRNEDEWIKLEDARKISDNLGDQTEQICKIVTETIDIPNTTRIGNRFAFIAQTESLEQAERIVAKATQSPLASVITKARNAELYGSTFRYRIEESATGYRRNVQVFAVTRLTAGMPRLMGFKDDEGRKSGVAVDIDTFTRPAEGHFQDTSMYIKKSFNSSSDLAVKILDWLTKENRKK